MTPAPDKIFPVMSMVISAGAAGMYYLGGRPDKGTYWLLGCAYTAVVTFWIK